MNNNTRESHGDYSSNGNASQVPYIMTEVESKGRQSLEPPSHVQVEVTKMMGKKKSISPKKNKG